VKVSDLIRVPQEVYSITEDTSVHQALAICCARNKCVQSACERRRQARGGDVA